VPPLAQRGIAPVPLRALPLVLLIDLEVERGRIVEDEIDVRVHEIGHGKIDRALEGRLLLLEEVHGPVEVLELERPRARQEDLLGEPLLPAGELGRGRERPVRNHGEERPLERLADALPLQALREQGVDAEFLPELLEHVDAAVRPARVQADVLERGELLLAGEDPQDALGEAAQRVRVELVSPAEVVDDLGDGAAARGVPDVLGELVVAHLAAILVPAPRGAEVHA